MISFTDQQTVTENITLSGRSTRSKSPDCLPIPETVDPKGSTHPWGNIPLKDDSSSDATKNLTLIPKSVSLIDSSNIDSC